MKALIIAAGRGKRLGNITNNTPKPLVKITDKSFFDNIIDKLHYIGIDNIAAIVGYKKEAFKKYKNIKFYENNNWKNNNILHSLFCAKDFMDEDIIISYSDIWFSQEPFNQLKDNKDDIVLSVDKNWEDYYKGRTEHPIDEAENVYYNDKNIIYNIGKHIYKPNNSMLFSGEFMGLLKISKKAITNFVREFEELQNNIKDNQHFQNAKSFQNAYLTDFIQYLIDKGYIIKASLNSKGWSEIDTIQDLNNLKKRINNEK